MTAIYTFISVLYDLEILTPFSLKKLEKDFCGVV